MPNDIKLLLAAPGQGSQGPGMIADFEGYPLTRELLEQADDTLATHLTRTLREGSEEELRDTRTAQPALVTISYIAAKYLESQLGKPLAAYAQAVAGHSVGEYAAAAWAGALDFPTLLKLVSLRAGSMAQAVPQGQGSMTAILGLEISVIENLLHEVNGGTGLRSPTGEVDLCLANDNSPGQVILSGPLAALEKAEEAAKALGAKRVLRLNVSGPFHTPAMQPAASAVAAFLSEHPLKPLQLPLYANSTAQTTLEASRAATNLAVQITGRVRWREIMENAAAAGITQVLELGSGKVLSGLAPRCDARLAAQPLNSRAGIDAWLESQSRVQPTA